MEEPTYSAAEDYVTQYLAGVLEDRIAAGKTPDGQAILTYGAGHLAPTVWADAPWRIEAGCENIPFTFIVRDAEKENVKMRLKEIAVYEAPDDEIPWKDKTWQLVHRFVDGMGEITKKYWTYRAQQSLPLGPPPVLPLTAFQTAVPGKRVLLNIAFRGSQLKPIVGRRRFEIWRPLAIYLASEALPLHTSPQWHYGDTHYHSNYTNDVKEYGNPVPDTRAAAQAIGLDWLVITDHSVDLEDANPYWEDRLTGSRWGDLGVEVLENSDEDFLLMRGEEVTVLGQKSAGDDTLHMLAFGHGFEKMVPGAFARKSLFAAVATRLNQFSQDLYKHLFGSIYRLEAVLTGVDKAGQAVTELKDCSIQTQHALAFAAHPASFAQSPGGTWEFYDLTQPIHGMEAWNGNLRFLAADEESPFDDWEKSKDWKTTASYQAIQIWDQILRQKVGLDDPKFILLAGSDAHGAYNYSEGWWIDWDGLRADDNSLGKVRTLLYMPHRDPDSARNAPTAQEVTQAIRSASCVITDGPVLNFTLKYNEDEAFLGGIISLEGDGALNVNIQTASTPEFGPIEQVRVVYYIQGMDTAESRVIDVADGQIIELETNLVTGPGYVRLEAETHKGEETYRCFTNPIWIKSGNNGKRKLTVTFKDT